MSIISEPQHASAPSGWREYFLDTPVRHCRIAGLVVVLMGAAYRLSQYLPNRSFWLDEAFVLSNVLHKDLWALMGRLDHDQSAPPLFLWCLRGLALGAGPAEWVMRLLPLMAGVLSLVLLMRLAWRTLGPAVSLWVVAWFAFSTDLVWHSVSMKQYSGDGLVSIGMLVLATRGTDAAGSVRRWWTLVALAVPATWFSQPAIFMFAGISVALLPELRRRGRVGMWAWLGGNALVGAAFGLMFWFMRFQRVAYLVDFWHEDMANWSRPWTIPWWILRESYRLCELPYKAIGPGLAGLAVLGVIALWKRDRRLLGLCVLPVIATMLAGLLRRYPYHGGRVTLFLVPGLLLLGGAGLGWLRENLGARWRPWWWVAGLPMVAVGIGEAAMLQVHPMGRSHIRPVVEYLREHRAPEEAIYLVSEGSSADKGQWAGGVEFLCYWPGTDESVHTEMPAAELIPEARFWVVFAFLPRHGTRHLEPLLAEVRRHAEEEGRLVVKEGGAAFLFRRRVAATTRPAGPGAGVPGAAAGGQ